MRKVITKMKKTITCNVENLYKTLKEKGLSTLLSNYCEVIEVTEGDLTWYDIVRQGGTIPIISDGDEHAFIQNENLTWSNIPTEDSGSHEVVLTSEQFAWLGG